jgi:hypothetical protein
MDRSDKRVEGLLATSLSMAVTLIIMEMAQHGGPTEDDYKRVKSYQDDLLERGNDLFYPSKKEGDTAKRFNQVADAIAVLSFAPGGITVFGLHFDSNARLNNYRKTDSK